MFIISLPQDYECDLGVYNEQTGFFESWESTEKNIGIHRKKTLGETLTALMEKNNVTSLHVRPFEGSVG